MNQEYRDLLSRAVLEIRELKAQVRAHAQGVWAQPIAIQGLAGRFPGAPDLEAFGALLMQGRCAIGEVPAARWDMDAWYHPDPDTPGKMYVRRGGFLDSVDRFDAPFFHISRREAESMDPQQRFILETAWAALEDAGISPDALAGSRTGVFVALSGTEYAHVLLRSGTAIDAHSGTGVVASVAAGRLAHVLGVRGPALVVDTACSSSLVALHLASGSLLAGECDRAIVVGVNVILTPQSMASLCRSRALSPDGLCKTFDARADGYARGKDAGRWYSLARAGFARGATASAP